MPFHHNMDSHSTLKHLDVQALLQEWLQLQMESASQKGTNGYFTYSKALFNVKQHPDPITSPKSMKLVLGVGDKMVAMFLKHLLKHCQENHHAIPAEFDPKLQELKRKSPEKADLAPKKKRKLTPYIPRKRSGGYAILLALYLKDRHRKGLKKDEITDVASKFCDTSFKNNPANNEFYSAWNSIKQLEKHELVTSASRRSLWYITDEGIAVAEKLKAVEGINSSPIAERIQHSFDNGILATPDNSFVPADDDEVEIQLVDDPRELLSYLSSPLKKQPKEPLLPDKSEPVKSIPHDKHNRVLNNVKYSIWPSDQYDVVLVLDAREIRSQLDRDYFASRFKGLGVSFDVRHLPVGDAAWIARHKNSQEEVLLNTICERKRLDDLASSIRDGRFEEQKNRLKKSCMKRYYYLVEEVGDSSKIQILTQHLQTAQSMTILWSNFCLKRLKNLDDTTVFLASLTKIISDTYALLGTRLVVMKPRIVQSQKDYGEMLDWFRNEFEQKTHKLQYECCHLYTSFRDTLGKSHMYTVKETFLSMLMAIRGVSLEKALAVQSLFPTPKSLLEFYQNSELDLAKETALHDLLAGTITRKKVGKALLQKIYQMWGRGATD